MPHAVAERLTIVGIGDSTTAGTPGFLSPLEAPPGGAGNPESQYAFWMMRIHPEWTVLNRGVNGATSAEVRARFGRDVLAVAPDYAIILAGVNDIFMGVSASHVERNLGPMYAEALDAGIVPVAATVLPYNDATRATTATIFELNHWIEFTAKLLGLPFADTHRAVADPEDPSRLRGSPDGHHPDVDGYRRMGEVMAACIEADLPRRRREDSPTRR